MVKEIRPFILACIVKNVNLRDGNLRKFLQIQTKLHDNVCGKREKSTIATHDLAKIPTGGFVQYTAHAPDALSIVPLGRAKKVTAQKLYDDLKAEAEALRKEKKRNVYSGVHKYLYLLEGKQLFACVEDATGTCISLPPLTNGEATKVRSNLTHSNQHICTYIRILYRSQISPETTEVFVEVTSSTSMTDCRATIEELLREMLLAGFGTTKDEANEPDQPKTHQLLVQQVKSVDPDGNLRAVYPSKADLNFDESAHIFIEREN